MSTALTGPVKIDMSPNASVIRFRPVDVERVKVRAEVEFARIGHYGLSVFADVPRAGETAEGVQSRLVAASGRTRPSDKSYFVCDTASCLLGQGFTFWKDMDGDEPPEHYCVVLGETINVEIVQLFLDSFHAEAMPL